MPQAPTGEPLLGKFRRGKGAAAKIEEEGDCFRSEGGDSAKLSSSGAWDKRDDVEPKMKGWLKASAVRGLAGTALLEYPFLKTGLPADSLRLLLSVLEFRIVWPEELLTAEVGSAFGDAEPPHRIPQESNRRQPLA